MLGISTRNLVSVLRRAAFAGSVFILSISVQAAPENQAEEAPVARQDLGIVSSEAPRTVPQLNDEVDYSALRIEYGRRADFMGLCEFGVISEAAYKAFGSSDYQSVLKLTEGKFEQCPVDLNLHFIRAVSFRETDQDEVADLHMDWFEGLVDSITSSGDGRTPQTAFETISVNEEYALISVFGLEPKSQALLDGPPTVDAVTVVDKEGNEDTIYFHPKWHFLRLAHEFPDE